MENGCAVLKGTESGGRQSFGGKTSWQLNEKLDFCRWWARECLHVKGTVILVLRLFSFQELVKYIFEVYKLMSVSLFQAVVGLIRSAASWQRVRGTRPLVTWTRAECGKLSPWA